jgi:hypothetical protein
VRCTRSNGWPAYALSDADPFERVRMLTLPVDSPPEIRRFSPSDKISPRVHVTSFSTAKLLQWYAASYSIAAVRCFARTRLLQRAAWCSIAAARCALRGARLLQYPVWCFVLDCCGVLRGARLRQRAAPRPPRRGRGPAAHRAGSPQPRRGRGGAALWSFYFIFYFHHTPHGTRHYTALHSTHDTRRY